jgi:hypothetical protein
MPPVPAAQGVAALEASAALLLLPVCGLGLLLALLLVACLALVLRQGPGAPAVAAETPPESAVETETPPVESPLETIITFAGR